MYFALREHDWMESLLMKLTVTQCFIMVKLNKFVVEVRKELR